nr:GNAT family N-acetyltransferase [Rhizobium setariae]
MFFIRSAGEGDLAAVSKIIEACEPRAPRSVQNLKADLKRPDSEFVVADDGRQLGGMGYAAMAKEETGVVILHRLHVSGNLTGQGIGRDIFAELETCFPDAKRMRVEVEKADEASQGFFTSLGFAEIGWAKQGSDRPHDAEVAILEKSLVF